MVLARARIPLVPGAVIDCRARPVCDAQQHRLANLCVSPDCYLRFGQARLNCLRNRGTHNALQLGRLFVTASRGYRTFVAHKVFAETHSLLDCRYAYEVGIWHV